MYEIIRRLILPLEEIEKLVPRTGRILDVGCGHGTIARFLVKKSDKRIVKGIDPSKNKVETAKKLSRGFKNLSFENKYINEMKEKFDCIIVSDVLYLLPDKKKASLLKKCKQLLGKNGLLIVKTDSHEPKWLFKIIRFQEFIMVNLTGLTYSDYGGFYSLNDRGYMKIIKQAGFEICKRMTFKSTIPYRHLTYVAKIAK